MEYVDLMKTSQSFKHSINYFFPVDFLESNYALEVGLMVVEDDVNVTRFVHHNLNDSRYRMTYLMTYLVFSRLLMIWISLRQLEGIPSLRPNSLNFLMATI